jgi:hypothetical protein
MAAFVSQLEIAAGVLLVGAAAFMAGWKMRGERERERGGWPDTPTYLLPVARPRRRRAAPSRSRW